jgi:hypothetical protein
MAKDEKDFQYLRPIGFMGSFSDAMRFKGAFVNEIIRNFAEKDRIAFKKHCVLRMNERKIRADEIRNTLTNGEIIEAYPDDRPLQSYLVLGTTEKERPIHAVVAADMADRMLWVITVYIPDPDEWDSEFRRRKKQ